MANELATRQKTGIATYLANDKVKNQIVSLVGEKATPTFISSVVSAVQTNPALAECSNSSILSGALLGESLKLTPSPQLGQYYLVPFKNTKTGVSEAQFQLGAKGYKQLAVRSGQYKNIVVSKIKDGELSSYNPITEEFTFSPIMDMKKRAELPTIGYYASFELLNGFKKEIYWSKEQMEHHAETYSQGYRNDLRKNTKYTFWSKDFDAMAEKTMIRQLISKWGIMSVEMQKAVEGDMGVIREDGSVDYVDNNQDDIIEVVAQDISDNANQVEFVAEDVK